MAKQPTRFSSNGTDDVTDGMDRRYFLAGASGAGAMMLAGCIGGQDGESTPEETEPAGETEPETEVETETEGSTDVGKIGVLTHLTGRFGEFGVNVEQAVNFVADEINATGGAAGNEVEVVTFDTRLDAQRALQGLETLDAQNVDLVIGPASSSIPNLVEPVREKQLPMLICTAGTTFLDDKGGRYIWRTSRSDSELRVPEGLYAIDQGWDTMAAAYIDNQGSTSYSKGMASFFEDLGGSVLEHVAVPAAASSYRSTIQRLVDTDPDVIHFTAGENSFPQFIQNYTELGVDLPLMGGNELTQSVVDAAGPDLMEGVIAVSPVPAGQGNFAERFEAALGEEPGLFHPTTYDAINLVGLAWERAGETTRSAIVDNIRSVATPGGTKVTNFEDGKSELESGNEIDYEGAGTNCNFDQDGDVFGSVAVQQVQDGEFERIQVYTAEDIRNAVN